MIEFGLWAPSREAVIQSWVAAGILDVNGIPTPDYSGVQMTDSWPGIIDGVAGYHCNVRVSGPLVAEMTYGLPQHDAGGNLLDVFDRTWAAQIFQLTAQPADPVTGFPAGMRNSAGVTYCDIRDIVTPSCVWA